MNRRTTTALTAAGLVLLASTAAGCGALHPEDFPLDEEFTFSAATNPQEVTADEFGRAWNLSVDHGTIACVPNADGDPVLTFTGPDDTVYALNALAENAKNASISEITTSRGRGVATLLSFAFSACDRPPPG
ncbi:hypothetical protein ACI1US_01455 [Leucobacter sp. BZR 635]